MHREHYSVSRDAWESAAVESEYLWDMLSDEETQYLNLISGDLWSLVDQEISLKADDGVKDRFLLVLACKTHLDHRDPWGGIGLLDQHGKKLISPCELALWRSMFYHQAGVEVIAQEFSRYENALRRVEDEEKAKNV